MTGAVTGAVTGARETAGARDTGAEDTGAKAGDNVTLSSVQVTAVKGASVPDGVAEHATGVQAPAATCVWVPTNRVVQDASE